MVALTGIETESRCPIQSEPALSNCSASMDVGLVRMATLTEANGVSNV
jgi:hypothetical protein